MSVGMARGDLARLMRTLLAEILELTPDAVSLDADLADELGADSLNRLELMTLVERRLGVRLEPDAWRSLRTVRELADATAAIVAREAAS